MAPCANRLTTTVAIDYCATSRLDMTDNIKLPPSPVAWNRCDIEDAADEILENIKADRQRISNSLDKRIEDAVRLSLLNHDGYYDGLAYGYYIADRIVKGETK